ncbi:hypothetical protein [Peterkaempfera bronchialis]|uniref:hypothetical protein n=1 Tax=Peterkaempfera bronchialis TaxID=2126346 RepID=UPI003C2BFDDD
MPRPTPAQVCWGTLAVVSATVVLLAVSGADSPLSITVLVVFALALGTLGTTLSITGHAHRTARTGGTAHPARASSEAGYAQPSSSGRR